MKKQLFIISALLLLYSCKTPFEREKEFFTYLKEVQRMELSEKQLVLLMQTNFCGACTEEVQAALASYIEAQNLKTTVVLSSNEKEVKAFFQELPSSPDVRIDPAYKMEQYGMKFTSDLLVIFEEGRILSWAFLDDKGLARIGRRQ
jgi:hypothetical protein